MTSTEIEKKRRDPIKKIKSMIRGLTEGITRDSGTTTQSHKQGSTENVQVVEETMKQRTTHKLLELVSSVDKRGIGSPTAPRERQCDTTTRIRICDNF